MNQVAHLLAVIAVAVAPIHAQGDAGHDHGPTPQVVGTGPQRLPDGSVYLPKLAQRQLGVRTQVAEPGQTPRTFELFGKVTMDPNAGGKVQPTIAGRIEVGSRGLPSLGQSVRKGEILAYVRPSAGTIERANQAAQAAELRANLALAEKRLARLQLLEGSVPQKEIDAAKAEVQSLTERLAVIGGSLSGTEALVAPASGVIASATAVAGQVVDAREVLFEVVDPTRLQVEAIAHDPKLVAHIRGATARIDPDISIPLALVGAGRSLRELALPVMFRFGAGPKPLPPLTIGQPLTVLAQTDEIISGYSIPATAVVKDRNNQDIVWVHVAAERFAPRTVRYVPTDGATATVVDGVAKGDRIVVQGTSLLNQVR